MNMPRITMLTLLATACANVEPGLHDKLATTDDAGFAETNRPASSDELQLQHERMDGCTTDHAEEHAAVTTHTPTPPGFRVPDDPTMNKPMPTPLQPSHAPSPELLDLQDDYLERVAVLELELADDPAAFERARADEKARIFGE